MRIAIVAYPQMAREDEEWISAIQKRHNELGQSILPPHFTLVFPLAGISEEAIAEHIGRAAARCKSVAFVLRCAIFLTDDSSDKHFVVLVPDEGFSGIVKLHDRLYTGILEPSLRLDIPYVPHITIGYSMNARACKEICDALNREEFEIKGSVSRLDLVRLETDKAWSVQQFELR